MNILTIKSSSGSLGKNVGCEDGPYAILKLLKLKTKDIPIDQNNIEQTHNNILKHTKNFTGLILGGDHSFSYSSMKTFFTKHKNAQLVVFDAHADCVNTFYPPSHEDYLRVLLDEKIVKPSHVTLIGTRAVHKIEQEYLNKKKIHHYPQKDLTKRKDELIKHLRNLKKPYYLSIDIDVLDPSDAPGTGYPEKNGMKLTELLSFLACLPKPTVMDIVEVNPHKDKQMKTVKSAAKIIQKVYS